MSYFKSGRRDALEPCSSVAVVFLHFSYGGASYQSLSPPYNIVTYIIIFIYLYHVPRDAFT